MSAEVHGLPLLEVRGLSVGYAVGANAGESKERLAVERVDLELRPGESLALLGESGCGKTTLALALLRLVPPPGRILAGQILYEGRDLVGLGEDELRRLRGARIGMVFQDPTSALNPVYTVGEQVAEVLRCHQGASRPEARMRAVELLARVGLPAPAETARLYPHQLSGGMRQRALIAAAIACEPALLIADEPTTALDTTVQAQVLDLLCELQAGSGMALLYITHNLGVAARVASRAAIMYAGRIVESGALADLLEAPAHPYTLGLLRSAPERARPGEPLGAIPGSVPSSGAWPAGCRFHPRCELALERCRLEAPELRAAGARERLSACHRSDEVPAP